MKVGDLVMFSDNGRYAKWFFGRFANVTHCSTPGAVGYAHCRVEWVTPVMYHGRPTTISDFPINKFTIC